ADRAAGAPRAGLFSASWTRSLARAAAVLVLVAAGILIGRQTAGLAPQPPASAELAALRGELHDLRQTVMLSLMQQQSASDRLRGVSWSGQIDRPSGEVVSALLDAL